MPRPRALTDAQVESLLALPSDEPLLVYHWILSGSDLMASAPAIATTLMDELRRRRIIAPGPSVIERLVAAVLVVAERHVAGQLTAGLSRIQNDALDALL
jgi:hypothetical protein